MKKKKKIQVKDNNKSPKDFKQKSYKSTWKAKVQRAENYHKIERAHGQERGGNFTEKRPEVFELIVCKIALRICNAQATVCEIFQDNWLILDQLKS